MLKEHGRVFLALSVILSSSGCVAGDDEPSVEEPTATSVLSLSNYINKSCSAVCENGAQLGCSLLAANRKVRLSDTDLQISWAATPMYMVAGVAGPGPGTSRYVYGWHGATHRTCGEALGFGGGGSTLLDEIANEVSTLELVTLGNVGSVKNSAYDPENECNQTGSDNLDNALGVPFDISGAAFGVQYDIYNPATNTFFPARVQNSFYWIVDRTDACHNTPT